MSSINIEAEIGKGDGFRVFMDENMDLVIHVDMDSRVGESKSGKHKTVASANWYKVEMPQGKIGISLGVWIKEAIRQAAGGG